MADNWGSRRRAERWLRSYHGPIDSTALVMAHEAGQRSALVLAERERDLERVGATRRAS